MSRPHAAHASTPPPPPRRRTAAAVGRRIRLLLFFVSLVLIVNAVVGERGFVETRRARGEHEALATAVAALRAENAALRDQAERLQHDPATIEQVARARLGLIRPGELVVVVKPGAPSQPR